MDVVAPAMPFARHAETDLFRRFQYLTVPLHLMPSAWDRARTALDQAYLEAMATARPDLAPGPGRSGVCRELS